MSPFVVTVLKNRSGGFAAYLSRSAHNYKDADQAYDIGLDLAQLPRFDTRINACDHGSQIDDALRDHPAIEQMLGTIDLTTKQAPATLLFEIRAPEAEAARWEGFCRQKEKFPSIDQWCRVGRVAKRADAVQPGPRTLTWPLRMAAYLSAAEVSARTERDEIISVIEAARKAGLDVACDIYLGEAELIEETRGQITAGQRQGIAVHPMPATAPDLQASITASGAHLLHFFCHGVVHTGLQHLEFATINDWEVKEKKGHALLSLDRLNELLRTSNVWMTVLNCCQGAEPLDRAHSMAYAIVVKGGCPASVGMNEPIESVDASAFARVFYQALFNNILPVLRTLKTGGAINLDVTPAVVASRVELHDKYRNTPEMFGRWSLPVLYLSAEHIAVTLPPADISLAAGDPQRAALNDIERKVAAIARTLRGLPAGTPALARLEIYELLDQPPEVPEAMRPDLHGQFPDPIGQ